jgi:hypothetical protein
MDTDTRPELRGRIVTIQIVIGALIAGATVFAVVAIVIQQLGVMNGLDVPVLTYLAIGMTAMAALTTPALASQLDRVARQQLGASASDEMWLDRYQQRAIMVAALFESAAFFGFMIYLIGGQPAAFAAGLVAVLLMALLAFPTQDRIHNYIDRQWERASLAPGQ